MYNFTHAKGSQLLGISKAASHKHLRIMLEKGWCILEYGNLRILGINKLKDKFKNKLLVAVDIKDNRKSQITHFRYAIIHNNLHRQHNTINKKTTALKKAKTASVPLRKKENQLIMRNGGTEALERKLNERTTLSNKKIGSKLNRSQKSGANYQKQFVMEGLLASFSHYEVLHSNISQSSWSQLSKYYDLRSNVKYDGRNVVSQSSNTLIPAKYLKGAPQSFSSK